MKIKLFLFIALISLLVLAACGGGATPAGDTGTGNTGGNTAGETDGNTSGNTAGNTGGNTSGDTAGEATDAVPATGVEGLCPGVDIAALTTAGQDLYTQSCAGCHGAAGEGQGDFPALTDNTVVSAEDATQLVTGYFAVDAHPKDIAPDQLAGLFSFMRQEFGGGVAAVCPDLIQQLQPTQ